MARLHQLKHTTLQNRKHAQTVRVNYPLLFGTELIYARTKFCQRNDLNPSSVSLSQFLIVFPMEKQVRCSTLTLISRIKANCDPELPKTLFEIISLCAHSR